MHPYAGCVVSRRVTATRGRQIMLYQMIPYPPCTPLIARATSNEHLSTGATSLEGSKE
mgnify:CR=1 FL=1